MLFKELYKGIDSLYLSFTGELKEGVLHELEEKLKLARAADLRERAKAVVLVMEHQFHMKKNGRTNYPFILEDAWLQIEISKRRNFPTIYIQLKSAFLNVMGIEYAKAHVRKIAEYFLKGVPDETVSRADIFIDFMTGMDFGEVRIGDWITRAEKLMRSSGDRCTGWDIGRGGDVFLRLYDKTAQITCEQDYLKEFWRKAGWVERQKIWRAEFQLRRSCLKQFSINTISDFLSHINEVWKYCTTRWARLAIPDNTINRTRLQTHPLWQEIQNVKFGSEALKGLKRKLRKERVPEDKHLYPQSLGFISTFCACNGHYEVNVRTMYHYLEAIKSYFEKRHFDGYGSFGALAKGKIAEKRRLYNRA